MVCIHLVTVVLVFSVFDKIEISKWITSLFDLTWLLNTQHWNIFSSLWIKLESESMSGDFKTTWLTACKLMNYTFQVKRVKMLVMYSLACLRNRLLIVFVWTQFGIRVGNQYPVDAGSSRLRWPTLSSDTLKRFIIRHVDIRVYCNIVINRKTGIRVLFEELIVHLHDKESLLHPGSHCSLDTTSLHLV